MHILHAASEYHGLAKTGGLADMVTALTTTLHRGGHDVRVCLPAYRGTREKLLSSAKIASLVVRNRQVSVIEGRLQRDGPLLWLIDCAPLFDRPGSPYGDATEPEFVDNALRFATFGDAVSQLALGIAGWRPDAAHLHDWHCGLAALQLSRHAARPRVIFTIHNLAYQGLFNQTTFNELALPPESWQLDGVEFHGQLSFMKAGLVYSDVITTVSPSYAKEIQTPALGCGLDGLLRHHKHKLFGIVNGIDAEQWNPATDSLLTATYDSSNISACKAINKRAIQRDLGLPQRDVPMLVFIGRLAHQKGADLIFDCWQQLTHWPLQLVVLGRGDTELEMRCRELAKAAPDQFATHVAIDEELAHRLTGAADMQLMPSRFEPCGLSQMYAQRYGTIPVAHRTGGLIDTITDTTPATLANGDATGILFDEPNAQSLLAGVIRGISLIGAAPVITQLQRNAMSRDFSWPQSAKKYESLYYRDQLA